MNHDLEHRAGEPAYRSYGERRVASVLDQYGVPYEYERPILVTEHHRPRLWYPDFWLPDSAVAVEYFGLAGDEDYDRGVERKTRTYAENGIAMMPVFRKHLGRELPDYLMGGIERILHGRYQRFNTAYRRSHVPGLRPGNPY